MLTKRDREILEFIQEFKVVNQGHVEAVFKLSKVVANRRLRAITDMKVVRRKRSSMTNNFLYYVDKPTPHKLLVTNFFIQLLEQGGRVIYFKKEYVLPGLTPDAFCEYKYNGYRYFFFVEVQISNTKLDTEKYELYFSSGDWKKRFPAFPRIVVISDRKVEIKSRNDLQFIQVATDFNDFEKIFSEKPVQKSIIEDKGRISKWTL
jgi:hypothetical protein